MDGDLDFLMQEFLMNEMQSETRGLCINEAGSFVSREQLQLNVPQDYICISPKGNYVLVYNDMNTIKLYQILKSKLELRLIHVLKTKDNIINVEWFDGKPVLSVTFISHVELFTVKDDGTLHLLYSSQSAKLKQRLLLTRWINSNYRPFILQQTADQQQSIMKCLYTNHTPTFHPLTFCTVAQDSTVAVFVPTGVLSYKIGFVYLTNLLFTDNSIQVLKASFSFDTNSSFYLSLISNTQFLYLFRVRVSYLKKSLVVEECDKVKLPDTINVLDINCTSDPNNRKCVLSYQLQYSEDQYQIGLATYDLQLAGGAKPSLQFINQIELKSPLIQTIVSHHSPIFQGEHVIMIYMKSGEFKVLNATSLETIHSLALKGESRLCISPNSCLIIKSDLNIDYLKPLDYSNAYDTNTMIAVLFALATINNNDFHDLILYLKPFIIHSGKVETRAVIEDLIRYILNSILLALLPGNSPDKSSCIQLWSLLFSTQLDLLEDGGTATFICKRLLQLTTKIYSIFPRGNHVQTSSTYALLQLFEIKDAFSYACRNSSINSFLQALKKDGKFQPITMESLSLSEVKSLTMMSIWFLHLINLLFQDLYYYFYAESVQLKDKSEFVLPQECSPNICWFFFHPITRNLLFEVAVFVRFMKPTLRKMIAAGKEKKLTNDVGVLVLLYKQIDNQLSSSSLRMDVLLQFLTEISTFMRSQRYRSHDSILLKYVIMLFSSRFPDFENGTFVSWATMFASEADIQRMYEEVMNQSIRSGLKSIFERLLNSSDAPQIDLFAPVSSILFPSVELMWSEFDKFTIDQQEEEEGEFEFEDDSDDHAGRKEAQKEYKNLWKQTDVTGNLLFLSI